MSLVTITVDITELIDEFYDVLPDCLRLDTKVSYEMSSPGYLCTMDFVHPGCQRVRVPDRVTE